MRIYSLQKMMVHFLNSKIVVRVTSLRYKNNNNITTMEYLYEDVPPAAASSMIANSP